MDNKQIRRELQMEARRDRLDGLLDVLRLDAEQQGCPTEKIVSLEICAEEIFVNIASYAYGNKTGEVLITEEVTEHGISLCFQDCGIPYNPLEKADPDTTLPLEERQVGGLGIYMVKSMMDSLCYEYVDGYNCLTMKMTW